MTQEQEGIEWKDHLTIVIEHMYTTYKNNRPGHGIYSDVNKQSEQCDTCKNSYNPSHAAGCDHCFQLEFMNTLTPIKIQGYIVKNTDVLTNLIRSAQNWKRFQANIDTKRQSLVKEYKELFAHGDLFVIDDYDKIE
jgi:hypothetical protein